MAVIVKADILVTVVPLCLIISASSAVLNAKLVTGTYPFAIANTGPIVTFVTVSAFRYPLKPAQAADKYIMFNKNNTATTINFFILNLINS